MEWLVRFSMGLRPRKQDIVQLKNLLPELFEEGILRDRNDMYFHPGYPYRRIRFASLEEWIKQEPITIEGASEPSLNNGVCPLAKYYNNGDPNTFSMLTVGGFASNAPKKSFFDLVRKTHRGQKVKEVVITDRYIFTDAGEDGTPGGFNNVIEYLKTLNIEKNEDFTITTNPHAKNQGKKITFENYIKNEFPNVKFKAYHRNNSFHDRFYLVRDKSGQMKGVFGPSLNGLSSESIVIMGDINEAKILSVLNARLS